MPKTKPLTHCNVLCYKHCCNKPTEITQPFYPYCLRYPDVSKWMVENEHEQMQYTYPKKTHDVIDCQYYNKPKPEEEI